MQPSSLGSVFLGAKVEVASFYEVLCCRFHCLFFSLQLLLPLQLSTRPGCCCCPAGPVSCCCCTQRDINLEYYHITSQGNDPLMAANDPIQWPRSHSCKDGIEKWAKFVRKNAAWFNFFSFIHNYSNMAPDKNCTWTKNHHAHYCCCCLNSCKSSWQAAWLKSSKTADFEQRKPGCARTKNLFSNFNFCLFEEVLLIQLFGANRGPNKTWDMRSKEGFCSWIKKLFFALSYSLGRRQSKLVG